MGLHSIIKINSLDSLWVDYNDNEVSYGLELEYLGAQIGYGGFIHHLKNYVLRNNEQYKIKAEKHLELLFTSLDRLQALSNDDIDLQAINTIRETFKKYEENFVIAQNLGAKGASPESIDKVIQVDDAPGLKALSTLMQSMIKRSEGQKRKTSKFLNETIDVIYLAAAFIALVIILTVFLLFILHRRSLANALLEKSRNQLQSMVDTTADATFIVNRNGEISNANAATLPLLGYTAEELEEMTVEQLMPERFRNKHIEHKKHYYKHPESRSMGDAETSRNQFFLLTKGDREIPIEISLCPVKGGGELTTVVSIVDITERVQAQNALLEANNMLEVMASTDPLTRINNRRAFIHQASQEFERFKRNGKKPAFLFFDADNFKAINDTHGHAAGDQALISFVELLKNELRTVDVIGRIGGDEFAALLPETEETNAMDVATRICSCVKEHFESLHTPSSAFTVSIGLAIPTNETDSIEVLMSYADNAMYAAKERGRNRVVKL